MCVVADAVEDVPEARDLGFVVVAKDKTLYLVGKAVVGREAVISRSTRIDEKSGKVAVGVHGHGDGLERRGEYDAREARIALQKTEAWPERIVIRVPDDHSQ